MAPIAIRLAGIVGRAVCAAAIAVIVTRSSPARRLARRDNT
ncbi:hypothetical protein [Rhodovarius crocodyli]|nr:hypothetical protein [Rhodovarius crocodyli]